MPRLLTDDGVSIHYDVDDFRDPWVQDAPETVLLHPDGFARSMKWWQQWVPTLARRYRVLRYDVRGCGESSVPPRDADWSVSRLIKDALDLLNHLAIDRVHWVGFHGGAVMGELFAVTYPERIQSLTLVNGPPHLEESLLEMYALGEKDSLASMERYGLKEWLRRTNPGRLDMERTDPRIVEWHTEEQAKTPFHVAYKQHETFRGGDLRGVLPQIRVPTLLLAGDRSPVAPLEQQRAMQESIPDARLVVFEGIGEGIFLTMADRCVAETVKFIAGLPR
jgi:3-oxoadipate enol-lactonase